MLSLRPYFISFNFSTGELVLKGVTPYVNSYNKTPNDQISTF